LSGIDHLAVVNIGVRPTFKGVIPSVEVYLPDWSGDLYGKNLQMKLNLKLRGEMRFANAKELVTQIACDVQRAKSMI
jgi:riboflavin kinase/FMN adenylyltransferase